MRARCLLALLAVVPAPASAQSATGGVAGVVTSAEGEPLADVCVRVLDEPNRTARTAADGSYLVDDVQAGHHLVTFNACDDHLPGHAAEHYEDASDGADARSVEVRAGSVTGDVDAALEPAAVIGGRVTSESDDSPLPGTCVMAVDQDALLILTTRTDAEGDYALANLPGGSYGVYVFDCNEPFHHLPEQYDDVPLDQYVEGEHPVVVTVAAGEERSGVDAALERGGAVRGTTTALHTGREVSLVCVGLFSPDTDATSFPPRSTISGLEGGPEHEASPGDYLIGGVRPGSYVLGFQPPACGGGGYAEQWATGHADRGDADLLTVAEGQTVVVDAVLAPRPSIDHACEREEVVAGGGRFSDVASDSPHRLAIDCAAYYDIADGYGDGTFRPVEVVRRDQMATFVAGVLRAAGATMPTDPPDAFTDDDGSVHERAIDALAALGVVGGTGGGRFTPSQPVSRAQMATFLVNAYEATTGDELRSAGDAFSDDDASVHETRIDEAATAGFTAGAGEGVYRPGEQVRRESMATFVARLLTRVQLDRARPRG